VQKVFIQQYEISSITTKAKTTFSINGHMAHNSTDIHTM